LGVAKFRLIFSQNVKSTVNCQLRRGSALPYAVELMRQALRGRSPNVAARRTFEGAARSADWRLGSMTNGAR
jgi:hypothetical protein